MHLIIIFTIQICIIDCFLNITDTTNKIKTILTRYKSNRFRRCASLRGTDSFVSKTLEFVDRTEGIGEFLKVFNVSQCRLEESASYMASHVLDGLILDDELPDSHWHEYKSVHNKCYPSQHHERSAQSKWLDNLQRVAKHNREFLAGKKSYSLHLNFFGDFDIKDYFNKFLKLFHTFPLFDPAEDHRKTAYRSNMLQKPPKKFDWRNKGFKPRLEEQHQCGACYAFAVTHALQAQLYKKHGYWGELRCNEMIVQPDEVVCLASGRSAYPPIVGEFLTVRIALEIWLSRCSTFCPQQIVDCSSRDGNMGCDGGSLRAALRYAARDGLLTESQYPYVGKKGRCKYDSMKVRARARRWATLPAGDEAAIERTLATVGPLAVGLNASPFTFQLYRSGIYDDLFCTPLQLNHAMLLVGYTKDYWILLNWWGRKWGEDGYIRIRRGLNTCGVTNMATYVEL